MKVLPFYLLRNWFALPLSWGRFYNPFFQKIAVSAVENALAQSEYSDPKQREELRWEVFKNTLKKIKRNNKFYSSFLSDRGLLYAEIREPRDIERLPILTKQVMRGLKMNTYVSPDVRHTRIHWETTSGSTGEPFTFAMDKRFSAFIRANFYRSWRWAGADPYHPTINCAGSGLARATPNTLHISPDLIHSRIEEHAEAIKKSGAKIIRGFPLTNFELAKALRDSGHTDISFAHAFLYGNTLSEGVRKFFTEKFGSEVFDIYGVQEFGTVASECKEHNGMHIFEEGLILEVVNDRGEAVPDGESGNIIITSIFNEITPLVRYAPGDRGKVITGQCPCGRTLRRLELEGRDEELILRPDGERISSVSIRSIMSKYFGSFERYQVYQPSTAKVILSIVPAPSFEKKDLEGATLRLKKLLGEGIEIEAKIASSIPLTKPGKLRFIISDAWRNWYEKNQ